MKLYKNNRYSRSLSPGTVSVEDVVTITLTVVVVGLRIRIIVRHFSRYNMKLKRFEAEIINRNMKEDVIKRGSKFKLTSNSFSTRSPLGPKRG